MTDKVEIRKMGKEALAALIAELSGKLNIAAETEFASLGAMRMHAISLEQQLAPAAEPPFEPTGDADADAATATGEKSKFNTVGKRGPTLGTGAYAKKRIAEGADNKTILEEIHQKFPGAQTTMASIAFYRNAVKKEVKAKTPESLRAEAAELRSKADALDAEATALAEAQAAQAEKPALDAEAA